MFSLPLAYGPRIQAVPGVKSVANTTWFGGSLPAKKEGKADGEAEATTDWSNFFPNMAVDEPYFAMSPEFQIPPDQFQAYLQDMQGAVIGRKLADKFGWKIGDRFFLESFIPPYRKQERALRVRRCAPSSTPMPRSTRAPTPTSCCSSTSTCTKARGGGSTPAPTPSRSTTRRGRAR